MSTEKTTHYPDVDSNPDFPALEKAVLASWQQSNAFSRSIKNRPAMRESADEPAMSPQSGAPCESQKAFAGANTEFIFYDGPPFANGLPHYGHLLTGYVKDLYARYQTMRGKRVERRFGWDCHGLPAEMGSEKELGISGRAAIANFGIDKFNEHCRTSVMKYTNEWEEYVNRQARWVDFKNDYKTMDTNFMESVLWAFKQLYDKGLVYEAYRVMPYSWAAETPLSNFETKLDNSYREREDKAITVAFELNEVPKILKEKWPNVTKCTIAAWTTTPWTLPSNLALAVGDKVAYEAVRITESECRIYSDAAARKYHPEYFAISRGQGESIDQEMINNAIENSEYRTENIHFISCSKLLGLTYKPLFPYFADRAKPVIPTEVEGSKDPSTTPATSEGSAQDEMRGAFRILDGSSFVTDGDGTGIVHMAPGFGEDDQKCCEANGIEVVVPVDGQGKYTDAIFDIPLPTPLPRAGEGSSGLAAAGEGLLRLKGLNVIADTRKDEAEPYTEAQLKKFGLANLRIINYLKQTGQLIKQEDFKHNYPHCWRTDQPLIYRAMPSWYVEVTKFRDRAVEINKTINWIPDHIRDGQMAHMLATAPDWSISRNRFWGTPIPVWRRVSDVRSQMPEVKVFGSIAELEEFFGVKVDDLHRPFIDTLIIAKDGSQWQRVEDVFDCWFESGSMPFAQVHYPFENKEWFETHFPADFITEYVGQTRGWFNTLIMLSTALFDKAPFKNCICHGVVLDSETGLKYSKRLKNYKDPMEVMDKFGADALRWLMISSPVMRGHDLAVDPEGKFIRDVVRLAIKPIWNAYNFFTMYANADSIVARDTWNVERGNNHAATPPRTTIATNLMDRYILAKCTHAVATIQQSLDAYDTPSACDAVMQFFEVLNNWYIRRSKERFWKEEKDADKQAAYDTLYTVLVTMCQAAAPLLPLTLDAVYQGLTGEESVHLADFPSCHPREGGDPDLIKDMDWAQAVCNAALAVRNKVNIRVRQPISHLIVANNRQLKLSETLTTIIRDEVNVKQLMMSESYDDVATLKLSINSQVLGKRLPALMKQILPASKKGEWEQKDGAVVIYGETLLPAEYTLQLEPKPEYKNRAQALSTNDALVILDTTITEELKREGVARDLVRAIQQARKDAGLQVTDRIALGIAGDIGAVLSDVSLTTYIKDQTLAVSLEHKPLAVPQFESKIDLEGVHVTITLTKQS